MRFPNEDDKNERPSPQQPNPGPDWQRWIWPGVLFVLMLWVMLSSPGVFGGLSNQGTEIDYSDFRRQVERGNVAEVVFEGETDARGRFKSPVGFSTERGSINVTRFVTTIPPLEDAELLTLLRDFDARIVYSNQDTPFLIILLVQFAPFLLLIVFFVWMARRTQGQMTGIFSFGRSRAREYDALTPKVTFDDVAGQDAAKRELEEVVDYLKEPAKYIALGAKVPKGVLLIGPPGTGKTLMARAVAGEANVAFFSIAASEFVEMFVGVGASRVRDLFTRAKSASPSIIFIDELDAVGRQRGTGLGGGHDEREQTLNQILAEMDGFDQDTGVIMIAATNRPDVLDPALLRPGRFDRQVTVGLPDRKGRLSILKIHTRDKPLQNNVDLEALAKASIGFSGADIANLANEAALNAARHSRKRIEMADFTYAFERIMLGTERPPLSNEEERRVVAYHEAGHALVATLTPHADPVLKVTITPRGQALGITAFLPEDDRRNYSRKFLEARLRTGLGGRIAEEIVFDDITSGAAGDIQQITDIARRMVTQFGMSDRVGPINFGDSENQPFLGYTLAQGKTYSEETAALIDMEIKRIVDQAYEETRQLLLDSRNKLDKVALALLEREILERTELLELLDMEPDADDHISNIVRSVKEPDVSGNGAEHKDE